MKQYLRANKLALKPYELDKDHYISLYYKLHNIPKGGVLSAGLHKGNGTWKLSYEQLDDLELFMPASFSGNIELSLSIFGIKPNNKAMEQHHELETIHLEDTMEEAICYLFNLKQLYPDKAVADGNLVIENLPFDAVLSIGEKHKEGQWVIELQNNNDIKILSPRNLENITAKYRLYYTEKGKEYADKGIFSMQVVEEGEQKLPSKTPPSNTKDSDHNVIYLRLAS